MPATTRVDAVAHQPLTPVIGGFVGGCGNRRLEGLREKRLRPAVQYLGQCSRSRRITVAARHAPVTQTRVRVPNVPGGPALFKTVTKPVPASETWGTLTALDMTKGRRVLWQVKTPQPLVGGTLATAGGLVFTGEPNGKFNKPARAGAVCDDRLTPLEVRCCPMRV
jgi:hypothetical protein